MGRTRRTTRRSRQRGRSGGLRAGYTRYANLHGNSGVRSFSIAYDTANVPFQITVQFLGKATFVYTRYSAGQLNINNMVGHAYAGIGLQRYINFNKPGYV